MIILLGLREIPEGFAEGGIFPRGSSESFDFDVKAFFSPSPFFLFKAVYQKEEVGPCCVARRVAHCLFVSVGTLWFRFWWSWKIPHMKGPISSAPLLASLTLSGDSAKKKKKTLGSWAGRHDRLLVRWSCEVSDSQDFL